MDEDLKIVLTSELEADEQASAQRISAQLPNIAKLINSKSTIKVGVELVKPSAQNIQMQAQKISAQVSKAANVDVGVKFHVARDAKSMLKDALAGIGDGGVDSKISAAMLKNLDNMAVKIKSIDAAWAKVGKTKERVVELSIKGVAGDKDVEILQQYDQSGKKVEETMKRVSLNLEKIERQERASAARAQKDNESRVSYLTKQQSLLADIQATYTGATSVKPVTGDAHLSKLNSDYNAINTQIKKMIANEGRLDDVQRSNLEAQISNLKRLVKEYQNAEYVATKLKAKTAVEVNNDEVNRLAEYEEKLRSSGILTEDFQKKIAGLRKQLSTAFDRSSLTAYLDSFDRLEGEVDSFNAKIQSVDSLYSRLSSVSSKIATQQKQMAGMDTSSEEYAAAARRLEILQNEELSLGRQVATYQDVIQYSSQAAQYELKRLDLQAQVATSEAEVADAANKISGSLSTVGTTVDLVEAKFRALSNPTEELRQKVANLRVLMEAISNAGSDSERVSLFKQLNQEIAQCNKQITNLNGQARLDIVDPVFAENLKKARADLETVGRQWSSLKQDPGLNSQFQQLGKNLKLVESGELSLKEWTAQFSRFKSEVKAAGKNMQSFADILKNNIAKVAQWGLSTVSIYGVLSKLKSAVNIVLELDTAMIDLKKTTDETDAAYRRFYQSANETAKRLGVTTREVISQTAEWSRLGLSMQSAAKMAENSAIFKAISPELSAEEATDGLISIMKAYNLEADEMLDGVISKINIVGNELAVSNRDLVEVMTRSSSAMAAANNTFEETVSLATAATEITRDAASVGNGLKTLSMRLRGYSEETEEYSEDVAVLTGEIADLTKVASNNNRGISIFESGDPETYRSTYDILKDIADIWDELTDKNRASLLEVLFGKRQANLCLYVQKCA